MDLEKGIAYCGLACCLCDEEKSCKGCKQGACKEQEKCKPFFYAARPENWKVAGNVQNFPVLILCLIVLESVHL